MIIEVTLQLTGIAETFDDKHNLVKIFVGLKDSNQIFKQLWIRSRNKGTGYEQSEMVREGFCMGQSMDYNSKKSRKYTHSLHENVWNFNKNVCGTFIDIQHLKDGHAHTFQIELIIPFEDLAALQAFSFYPNEVLGDIELNFYTTSAGLVWCPVNPRIVKDYKTEIFEYKYPFVYDERAPLKISTQFSQINNPSTIISNYVVDEGEVTFGVSSLTLQCLNMRILSCESNMSGFHVKQSTLDGIRNIFSTPTYIPAEYLEYNAFPTPPNENGLRSTTNVALNNVKDIYIMFPKRTNDITVFENPCIDQFSLKVMGVQYPDKTISTLGPRFYQYALQAADLGGVLRPTEEFVNSYCGSKNNSDPNRTRYPCMGSDATSFALIIQTERAESGYVFDGIDSHGQSTPIDIQFVPLVKGDQDTYYNFDPKNPTIHPPAPQVWLCRDVYWSVDLENGLQFHKYGQPEGYEILA
jgi:hypothetical protein